jgi:3-deoxy-manno-octulosonate cytidylyltransferase (CMP-KDO synthetase)
VAEVVRSRGLADDAIIVNLQGDEPLLEPRLVELVADALGERPEVSLATLATPILTVDDLFSPHVVKVVLDQAGLAKTFGRAPLPWVRDAFGEGPHRPETLPEGVQFLRHVGLYAYRSGALRTLTQTPPPVWERAESLEQLRALWLGMSIHVSVLEEAPHHGVDTPQDAELASRVLTLRQRDLAPHPETHRPAG